MAAFDLRATLRDLASRNRGRSEADIQAQVRDVLLYGGFELGDESVALESPTDDHRRLDVEVGAVIIECKKDLRPPSQLLKAETQIGEYLGEKAAGGCSYAGVLTDGAIWRLYRQRDGQSEVVDELKLAPSSLDDRRFRWWLGAVLATERQVVPTAAAIEERLGAQAPSYRLVTAALREALESVHEAPAVKLKRELWAKLLRSALGSQFDGSDDLFVDHTYLVLLATLIGHAVAGFDIKDAGHEPGVLLSGQLFERTGLLGVGQAGFFDWVLDSDNGDEIVADIARRAASFDWADVDHDVLKALYQSVIAPDVRKRLGEYYTPDWLAKRMVEEAVTDPAHDRVLDPACGSGTFLFHAVRRYLDAADASGATPAETLSTVTNSIFGMDLHPVAVTLAQTTYLLAIGRDRLLQRIDAVNIPVYLGDSMRWEAAAENVFTSSGDVVLHTAGEAQGQLFGSEIRFPASVVADVGRFDHLVNELATRASSRQPGEPRPNVSGLLRRLGVADGDRPVVEATYNVLCDLHDKGQDHVWGFYIRNQARPTWLAREENRVDVLVGNPPWLAYRYMPGSLQDIYRERARETNLWLGGGRGRTTQQDLSAYFVARAVDLYLRPNGTFGFVMPRAVLSRQTYVGFRAADYSSPTSECYVAFSRPWDLEKVRPDPFPVPSSVVFGRRAPQPAPMPTEVRSWSGKAPSHGQPGSLVSAPGNVAVVTGEETASPYKDRFRQGAILVPRMLIMVNESNESPLGVPVGRRAVRSRKTSLDKPPWKDLPEHEGVVESIFIRPAYLGESIAPFRVLSVPEAIVPYDGTRLMDGEDERIDRYPGLAEWWRGAEAIWLTNRSSEKRTLLDQLDYMHQLSAQFPLASRRVVYTKAGNTLAAAVVRDPTAIIDHKLYWAPAQSEREAAYLAAVLNAPVLNDLVRPYQSVGAFGARDFDKYIWRSPIPTFDTHHPLHARLVTLAGDAEAIAEGVELPAYGGFQAARRQIRAALTEAGLAQALNEAVAELLAP
ncbi:MAG: N-6 DNA methylase [Solirubrobacteraceae bacterium]